MSKREIIFDSRNEYYKSPVGAVKSGTEISYRIKINASLDPREVDLVVLYDANKSQGYYRMSYAGEEEQTDNLGPGSVRFYRIFELTIPIWDRGLYFYWFEFSSSFGRLQARKSGPDNLPVIAGPEQTPWQQSIYKRDFQVPEWIKGGTFYHIFVDRFNHGGKERVQLAGKVLRDDWGGLPEYKPDEQGIVRNNDFFGGNLKGIIEKLPYIKSLGTNCIYLSPIFEAYSNHKYDTADYFHIDPMFGTLDDFRELCREAEKLGMAVILDGVFSHTGSNSRYFDKYGHYGGSGAYNNPNSLYRDWYYFSEDEQYESWWGIDTLPRINKFNEDYINFICSRDGVARYWIRQGASGWRLDVADELPNYFIDRLCEAVKEEKIDAIVIGEVWDDASTKISYDERKNYFQGNRLDSVMNYPLKVALIDYFCTGNAEQLAQATEALCENYPKDVVDCLMNNIGSHDTMRILTVLGTKHPKEDLPKDYMAVNRLSPEGREEAKRLLMRASALHATLPGVPCIYYGDEAGMEGYADPFNRRCYPWGNEDMEVLDWYRRIFSFRKEHTVYKDGSYRTLLAADQAYAFMRSNGAESIITAVNLGNSVKRIDTDGIWKDALSGRKFEDEIELAPGAILLCVKE